MLTQLAFICSNSTIETWEKGVNKNTRILTYCTPFFHVSIVDFEQVNTIWVITLSRNSRDNTCLLCFFFAVSHWNYFMVSSSCRLPQLLSKICSAFSRTLHSSFFFITKLNWTFQCYPGLHTNTGEVCQI